MNKEKKYIILAAATTALVALIFATIVLLPNKKTDNQDNTSAPSNTETSSQVKKDPQLDQVALPQLDNNIAKNESEVEITTTAGTVVVKLFNQYAPLAVENFLTHAKNGYYDKTVFHRIIAGFMIQGGDPKGNGTGGHSIWYGKNKNIDSGNGFKNEISPSLYNIRGSLSMANSGPDTNGSQFFINQNSDDKTKELDKNNYPTKIVDAYKKGGNPSLDGSYSVFGQVISGMDVVDKIATGKVKSGGEGSTPVTPVKINQIKILKEAQ